MTTVTDDDLQFNVRKTLSVSLLLVAAGFACLLVDVPLARLFAAEHTPREFQAILDRAEVFGHAYGIAAIALTIWFVSPSQRIWLPRFIAASYGAGLAADVVKLSVWRNRPCSYDLAGGVGDSFVGTIFTFQHDNLEALVASAHHSLPSAHTATAVAAAMVLGKIYPHAKGWFITLAVLVAANRIEGCAHFASDVCWGASVGYSVHALALRGGLPKSTLARIEQRIAKLAPEVSAAR